jgi:hypothetical protein
MDASREIATKLDAVDALFTERLGVSLWNRTPVKQISDIGHAVNDEDGLRSRIASLVNMFDVLNLSGFNKRSGVKEKATRASLVTFLKHEFRDDTPFIEGHIELPLGRIAQLRNHLLKQGGRADPKLLSFFDLNDARENASDTWLKVQYRLIQLLDSLLELLDKTAVSRISEPELSAKPLKVLVQETYERYAELIEDPLISSMLREIMNKGELLDSDLARTFNRPVKDIRKLLFPLLNRVLKVQPYDRSSTKLRIYGPMAAALENPDEWLKDESS